MVLPMDSTSKLGSGIEIVGLAGSVGFLGY